MKFLHITFKNEVRDTGNDQKLGSQFVNKIETF